MKHSCWCTVVIIGLLATSTVWSDAIYKWVDKEGGVHYSDRAPDEDHVEGDIETRPAVGGSPPPAASKEEGTHLPAIVAPSRPNSDRKSIEVEIYTTSWCPYCTKARDYLVAKGVDFIEFDVEEDPNARRRKNQLNPKGSIPTAVIDGQVLVGFSKSAYEKALNSPSK